MATIDNTNWRERLKNPNRVDGAWTKVTRHKNGSYYAQLAIDGKNCALPLRKTPGLAAADADR